MEIFLIILLGILLIATVSIVLPSFFGAPWHSAPLKQTNRLLEEAGLKQGETLVDLGCGNARVLILAARQFGAHGIGYEIDPLKVFISKLHVRMAGLSDKIKIFRSSAMKASLKEADVVYLYLTHQLIDKLKPRFHEELKPGTRIVSYGFMVRGFPLVKASDDQKGFIYHMGLGGKVSHYS